MNESIEFKSVHELYTRVKPALYSKVKELKSLGFKYVNENDIWNYLIDNNWKKKNNLQLYELISDILFLDNYKINDYVMKKMELIKKSSEKPDVDVL